MKCETCENEAMSEDSRFCENCAKAFGKGYDAGLKFAKAEEKEQ